MNKTIIHPRFFFIKKHLKIIGNNFTAFFLNLIHKILLKKQLTKENEKKTMFFESLKLYWDLN